MGLVGAGLVQPQRGQRIAVNAVNGVVMRAHGLPVNHGLHAGRNVTNGYAFCVEHHIPAAHHMRNGNGRTTCQRSGVGKAARLHVLRQRSAFIRGGARLYFARGVQRQGRGRLRCGRLLGSLLCHGGLPFGLVAQHCAGPAQLLAARVPTVHFVVQKVYAP